MGGPFPSIPKRPGSTLKIFFPRVVEGKSPYKEPSAVKDEIPRGEEVVLLVEDDETVRRTAPTC
jgi:hypothetical protein